jgi:ABC-type antimicrobial peptide transport system permease subunit
MVYKRSALRHREIANDEKRRRCAHDRCRPIAVFSVAGGVVGILVGTAASAIISRFANWQTVIGMGAVVLAVFFSALVGITFGYYPARKAAYFDPIEALRYE